MSDLYRVGNRNPRNIYRGSDHIGVVFSPADGPAVVAALNAAAAGPPRCTDCGRTSSVLKPWHGDVGGRMQPVAWLGPTCFRRRAEAVLRAVAVPLGGER